MHDEFKKVYKILWDEYIIIKTNKWLRFVKRDENSHLSSEEYVLDADNLKTGKNTLGVKNE